MFEKGFPFPFMIGLDIEGEAYTIPGTDIEVGVPTSCEPTLDPSVVPDEMKPGSKGPQI